MLLSWGGSEGWKSDAASLGLSSFNKIFDSSIAGKGDDCWGFFKGGISLVLQEVVHSFSPDR